METDTKTIAIATTEDYRKNLEGGCEFLWTDFGFPMCRKASICFLGFKDKGENRCPENKKFKERNLLSLGKGKKI